MANITIKQRNGQEHIVEFDDCRTDLVNSKKWFFKKGYVYTTIKINNKYHSIQMAYYLFGKPKAGNVWDHKDRNGLNNKRENIREATKEQNAQNKYKTLKPTTSKYKGVYYCKRAHRWIARIYLNKKSIHLGSFMSEEAARDAYNQKALEFFGEFAKINFL